MRHSLHPFRSLFSTGLVLFLGTQTASGVQTSLTITLYNVTGPDIGVKAAP